MRLPGAVLLFAICFAISPAHGAEYRAPRTTHSAPELDGLWTNGSLTAMERPDDFKTLVPSEAEAAAYEKKWRGKPPDLGPYAQTVGGAESEWWETDVGLARIRGQVRSSWIVSPADGKLPFSEQAMAMNKAERDRRRIDFSNPESRNNDERCLSSGSMPPLLNFGQSDYFQFVQTQDHVAIYAEFNHSARIVRIGGAHPPAHVRVWGGDSIGRWEGETLVVETTNFPAAEVGDPAKTPGADQRVIERITRTGPTELLYEFIVDAPDFIQSWRGEMLFRTATAPIYEYACHEGNYGLENILAGGRELDKAAAASPASPAPPQPTQGSR